MPLLRRSPLRLARKSLLTCLYHATPSAASKVTLGIRREDPQRIWERRCPLTPEAVDELVHRDGVQVLVQDCDRRVWETSEFVKAGATVHPTLSPAHIILGIKETPLHEVLNDPIPAPSGHHSVPRTHLMFSHTIKGQMYNMELLSKFVASSHALGGTPTDHPSLLPRLIDYELLTGEDGKRTVGFGWFAGVAGALESMNALAHAHLELGVASPFLFTPRPHTHPSLASIRTLLREEVGARIALHGTPKSLGPIVFGVTGSGKVADGVLDILQELPIVRVKVEDLPALVSDPATDLRKVYVVHALPRDYFVRQDGGTYDRADYYANPQVYHSEFHTKIAPYLSLLLHGAGWAPSYPRLMTNEQLTIALEKAQAISHGRFACVGDISCDIEGGLEFLPKMSTLSAPFFSTRPPSLPAHLPSVTMMAVDILPTALPLEASQHFSQVLLPYLRMLIGEYGGGGAKQSAHRGDAPARELLLKQALDRATVSQRGKLSKPLAWLEQPLGIWHSARDVPAAESESYNLSEDSVCERRETRAFKEKEKKRVLMLGSGMVAGPAIEEICKRGDVQLVVASNSLRDAERLTHLYPNATAISIDMGDPTNIEELVKASDVVISLLPVPFHPLVAKMCIRLQKHLVTASYISQDMRVLHKDAEDADVLLLNEIGLDPGIDHCSAVSILDSLKASHKEVVSFTSFCGGFPAPECAENVPLGYKFSWSPKGVLTAALNSATFRLWDRTYNIDGENLLQAHIPDVPLSKVLRFEGIANRNSLPYAEHYGLGSAEQLRTIFRGTLRYPGFSRLMNGFSKMGLLDGATTIALDDWASLARKSLEERLGTLVMDDEASIDSAIRDVLGDAEESRELVAALRWLSVLPHSAIESISEQREARGQSSLPPLPKTRASPIDLFATLLAYKLRYQPSERDLVVLHHEIVSQHRLRPGQPPDSIRESTHTSTLVAYGTPHASAMSRCVGLPVAFAALHVLDGGVKLRGVHGPTHKSVYKPILARLQEAGLGMSEISRDGPGRVEAVLHHHFGQVPAPHWLS